MVLLGRPVRLVALIAALGLAAVALWLWRDAGGSTPVSRDDALAAFAERGGGAGDRRAGAPRAGVYTYRQTGRERGTLGPVSVSRDLPGEARYVVTPTPDGYLEELLMSEEHVEAARLRLDAEGARVTWRRTHVTFAGLGRDDRREIVPPPLHMPRGLRPGRTWEGAYRAGGLRVTYRSRALRSEPVTVDGRALAAVVVQVDSITSGAHPGTRRDTLWWSPARSLPLRWRIALDVGGPAGLRTDAELVLRSAMPLV